MAAATNRLTVQPLETIQRRAHILQSHGTPKALPVLVNVFTNRRWKRKCEPILKDLKQAVAGIVSRHSGEFRPVTPIDVDNVKRWLDWKRENLR